MSKLHPKYVELQQRPEALLAAKNEKSDFYNGIYDRWNVTTGGTHELNRTSVVAYNGTSAIFNVYAITTDTQTTHDITVEALDADGNVLQQRTFMNVTLRNGYKTSYRGTFFIDSQFTSNFTVNDWNEYDTVDF